MPTYKGLQYFLSFVYSDAEYIILFIFSLLCIVGIAPIVIYLRKHRILSILIGLALVTLSAVILYYLMLSYAVSGDMLAG